MNMQKLLIYTKEELITYILKRRFFDKNTDAYEKRQKEIDKLYRE